MLGREEGDLNKLLENPDIVGVSLHYEWKNLEPAEGQYHWEELDRQIQEAAGKGKKVMIRIHTGIFAPDWIYAKGAKSIKFVDRNPLHDEAHRGNRATFSKELTVPIPWDEVFLSSWTSFVKVLGQRYGSNPTLAIVHITGGNTRSAELMLPHRPEDKKRWKEVGYRKELVVQAWQRTIDLFAQTFPDKPIAINLAGQIVEQDGAMEEIAEYGLKKYGKRFFMQNNALTSNPEQRRPDFVLMSKLKDQATIGFQTLAAASFKNDSRQGDLRQSIENGIRRGAKYFEIYAVDVLRQPEVIHDAAMSLK
jgi:hypothetical protein